jgi:predicted transcriptional regulator
MASLSIRIELAKRKRMTIREYCNANVICCEPDASISEVAALMRKHHVGDVVVVANQQEGQQVPLGILTDRDILVETIALDVEARLFTASDLMSSPVTTVLEDAGLTEALGVMRIEKGHVAGGELNGQSTALNMGLGKMVSKKKDSIKKCAEKCRNSYSPKLRSR